MTDGNLAVRLPALSVVEAIRHPETRLAGSRPWRVGCTRRGDGLLYLAAPGAIHRIGGDDELTAAWNSDAGDLRLVDDGEILAFDARGQEMTVEIRPDWSDRSLLPVPEVRSRMAGALGIANWLRLGALRIGIVGAGGLGSQLAVQLAADGVRDFTLCDPDRYDLSNLGRLPAGFGEEIVGLPKASVLASKIRQVNPGAAAVGIDGEFETWAAFKAFLDCDLVVCACDSALTRRAVARFGARYLVPLMSVGAAVLAGREAPAKIWEGAVWLPGDRGCLACLLGLDRNAAQEIDAGRQIGGERTGSLRSLNLAAVAWAMGAIEELACGELLESAAVRGEWIAGRYATRPLAVNRIPDCACPLLAAGDAGL